LNKKRIGSTESSAGQFLLKSSKESRSFSLVSLDFLPVMMMLRSTDQGAGQDTGRTANDSSDSGTTAGNSRQGGSSSSTYGASAQCSLLGRRHSGAP
jgi:hypothetical protein